MVIAVLSPGAMGSAVAARLVEHGACVWTSLDGRSKATADRARAAGMQDVSLKMMANADLILSIVPPGEAATLAIKLATHLREGRRKPVYIDCNALSPTTKKEIAGTVTGTGCEMVDGAIIGVPPKPGQPGPAIYVSGDQRIRVTVLRELGLDLRLIDGPVGAAAALKMSYAGINKGMLAVGTAMFLAASRSGTSGALYQELGASLPELLSKFETGIPDMYPKAYRWVAEMREIATFLQEDKAAAMMFEGAAQLYQRLATDFANGGPEGAALNEFFQAN